MDQQKSSREPDFRVLGVTVKGSEVIYEAGIEDAKRRIFRSWIVTGALTVFWLIVVVVGTRGEPVAMTLVMQVILVFYVVWSTYWGVLRVWEAWVGAYERAGCLTVVIVWYLGFPFTVLLPGAAYGIPGGGIYQYLKHRKMASTPRLS